MFVPPTFEGVTSVAIIEEILNDEVDLEVTYTSYIDFREYSQFGEASVIIVLGLAYRGYTLPDNFYINYDVPFTDFIHASTFGEQIPGAHIISVVTPETDPIKELYHFITTNPESTILSKYVTPTDKAKQMVEAVNAYRTWSWEGNNLVRLLLALYYASYKRLPNMVRNLELTEIVKRHAPLIKGQMEKMEDYITRKVETTKEFNVEIDGENCLLKVVFAEEYINELANRLLQHDTQSPIIVCVGRSTKSGDIFSIRTKNIDAGKVAYLINEGQGKYNVATVFSPIGYAELMGKSIVASLSENQSSN